MRPPASRMISAPAAMSHLLKPSSKKRVDASGGDIAQVERGRARSAYAGGFEHHRAQHFEVALDVLQVRAIREAGRDQRLL